MLYEFSSSFAKLQLQNYSTAKLLYDTAKSKYRYQHILLHIGKCNNKNKPFITF